MNGTGLHLNGSQNGNGSVLRMTTEEDVEDPEILAAIAASKEDLEEEVDPAVLAAIEASKHEAEKPKEEPKKENKGPIFLFGTLGKSDTVDDENDNGDDNHEDQVLEPDNVDPDDPDEPDEPGDLDPDDGVEPAPAAFDMSVDESTDTSAAPVKKVDHVLRRAYITKVKPEKRYCSSDEDSDDTWGGGGRKKKKKAPAKKAAPAAKKAAVAPTGPSSVFKCPHCALTFETIGQLNIHKHSAHG